MLKKSLPIVLSLIFLSSIFIISCKDDNQDVQDEYINQIEQEYRQSTNEDVVLESNNFGSNQSFEDMGINNNNNNFNQSSANKTVPATPVRTSRPVRRGPRKATINTFYSPWANTHKTDPLIIQEIRVMIANKEYTRGCG